MFRAATMWAGGRATLLTDDGGGFGETHGRWGGVGSRVIWGIEQGDRLFGVGGLLGLEGDFGDAEAFGDG